MVTAQQQSSGTKRPGFKSRSNTSCGERRSHRGPEASVLWEGCSRCWAVAVSGNSDFRGFPPSPDKWGSRPKLLCIWCGLHSAHTVLLGGARHRVSNDSLMDRSSHVMSQLRAGGIQHALRVSTGRESGSLSLVSSEPIPHVSSLC